MNKFNINDPVVATFHGKEFSGYITDINKFSVNGKDMVYYSVESDNGKMDSFTETELQLLAA